MIKINEQVSIEPIVTREVAYWNKRKKASANDKTSPVNITLSFDQGSKSFELAELIAKRLNWKIFDKELVDYIANNSKVRTEIIRHFDERTRSQVETIISGLINKHTMSSEKYFHFLVDTLISVAQYGSSIFLGRGSHVIVPDHMALKVRLLEKPEHRINNLMELKMDRTSAEKEIKVGAKNKATFLDRYFHQKTEDLFYYDLLINVSNLSLETAEDIIIEALEKKFDRSFAELYIADNKAS